MEPGSRIGWAKPLPPYELKGVGELGFALALGKPWQPAPAREITSAEMRSFKAATNAAGTVTLEWRGHPVCGDGFAVTATLARDGAYTFAYDGNESDYDVEWISFPDLVVPRTDATRILYPVQSGMVRLPKWGNAKPGDEVAGCRLYVYGTYPGWGATGDNRKGAIAANGIEVGDKLTVIGVKSTYKGTPQVNGGIYFSHQKPE